MKINCCPLIIQFEREGGVVLGNEWRMRWSYFILVIMTARATPTAKPVSNPVPKQNASFPVLGEDGLETNKKLLLYIFYCKFTDNTHTSVSPSIPHWIIFASPLPTSTHGLPPPPVLAVSLYSNTKHPS